MLFDVDWNQSPMHKGVLACTSHSRVQQSDACLHALPSPPQGLDWTRLAKVANSMTRKVVKS